MQSSDDRERGRWTKAPDAFRTISEVAEDLDLPQHVLRFWETRFPQIKPLKRGGGRRYYRPDDVDLLRGIRHLLYGEGYTIRGVQRILRDCCVRDACMRSAWRSKSSTCGSIPREFPARSSAREARVFRHRHYLPALLAPAPMPAMECGATEQLPDLPSGHEDTAAIPFRRSHAADAPRPAQDEEFAATEGARQSAEAARIRAPP